MFADPNCSKPPRSRGYLRPVKPPLPVWVDLGVVYPLPERPTHALADGVDLQATVAGELQMWNRTTTGYWIGWVEFRISTGSGSAPASQWIMASALSPRVDAPTRK